MSSFKFSEMKKIFYSLSFEIEASKVPNIIVFHFCADRSRFWPEVVPRAMITESASHHVEERAPHNTAHMRQHGKLDNFDVWSGNFPAFRRDFQFFWDFDRTDFLGLEIMFQHV